MRLKRFSGGSPVVKRPPMSPGTSVVFTPHSLSSCSCSFFRMLLWLGTVLVLMSLASVSSFGRLIIPAATWGLAGHTGGACCPDSVPLDKLTLRTRLTLELFGHARLSSSVLKVPVFPVEFHGLSSFSQTLQCCRLDSLSADYPPCSRYHSATSQMTFRRLCSGSWWIRESMSRLLSATSLRSSTFRPLQKSSGGRASPWCTPRVMVTCARGLRLASRLVFHSPVEFGMKALRLLLI